MKYTLSAILLTISVLYSGSAIASISSLDTITGKYDCSLSLVTNGEKYSSPAFRCIISQQGEHFTLEKTTGSQRFRGQISSSDEGFDFNGVFYCPWGDCTEDMVTEFKVSGPGKYQGTLYDPQFPNNSTLVDLKKSNNSNLCVPKLPASWSTVGTIT